MKIDPRQLRVADVVRLLNSSPLGEVVQPHVVYRHQNLAAYKIGDGRRIDLPRYAAWLFHARQETFPPGWTEANYGAHKDAVNARSREISEASRDIAVHGWVHEPRDLPRKERCRRSFRHFCEEYFPHTFHLVWSDDHRKVIAKIEKAVLEGELFAMAMPRGSGKTSLCEIACLWAMLYGHREFVVLIGADEGHAEDMLKSIKTELENNDLLDEDFSEVTGPIRALEGIHQRAAGQLCRGARTHIGWTAKHIVLPTMAGSEASGAIIMVAGITGRIRGMKYKRPDGKTLRPSLVLVDDPQTDDSARSPSQCQTRERLLAGAILGLAGPGKKIAGLMTLTVVRPDDMADRILNRKLHPEWRGERTKMVYAFPTHEKLWAQYAEIRAESLRNEGDGSEATEFYSQHQTQMDAGAKVAWPQRHNEDELSAIQHAMNLKFDHGEAAFCAEYQNEPLPELLADAHLLTADQIIERINGLARGQVPTRCQYLTAFTDVHDQVLYWMVCAWEPNFTGYIIDYGAFPDQHCSYFTLRQATATLGRMFPSSQVEGAIYGGLETLVRQMVTKQWQRDDGTTVQVGRYLIDRGYKPEVVEKVIRSSGQTAIVMPSRGRGIGAAAKPFAEYIHKPGELYGFYWRIPSVKGTGELRYVEADVNFWKSFVHARLAAAVGNPGSLTLYGSRRSDHRLLADHLTAESRTRTEGRGRKVDEWKLKPGGEDNHWLDCLVGCAMAASMLGCMPEGVNALPLARRRIRLSEMQAKRRAIPLNL